jgi:2'-5' RNA ligase
MRTFLAITLPPDVQRSLADLQSRIQAQMGESSTAGLLRWVKPAKLHLTLRFLGESQADQLARLSSGLAAGLRGMDSFELALGELGCFPSWQKMRVLWVGVRWEGTPLARVAHLCEEAAQAAGFPPEGKAYHPHITLAYVKSRASRGDVRAMGQKLADAQADFSFAALQEPVGDGAERRTDGDTDGSRSWRVEAIHLMESRAAQGGSRYLPLDHWSLGAAGRTDEASGR